MIIWRKSNLAPPILCGKLFLEIIFLFLLFAIINCKVVYSSDAKDFYNKGIEYFKKSSYSEAIASFSRAIEIEPTWPLAYIYRGMSYEKLYRFNEAISDLSRAIEIKPQFAEAYVFRGHVYNENAYYHKAIYDYNTAIKISDSLEEA